MSEKEKIKLLSSTNWCDMDRGHMLPEHPISPDRTTGARLHGRWLAVVRALWLAVTGLTLGLFADSVPERFDRLLGVAARSERVLLDLGFSVRLYATYFTALDLVIILTHIVIAAVIFWRKSDDWMALFVALTLVTTPFAVINALVTVDSAWQPLIDLVNYLGLVSSICLLYLFPDGRFTPRWTRPLALAWAVLNVPTVFFASTPFSLSTWPQPLLLLILVVWSATGLYAQVYRYIRVSTPVQRQQTKWAVFGLTAAVLGPVQYFLPFVTLPSLSQPRLPNLFYQLASPTVFQFALIFQLVGFTLFTFCLLIFPLSFAIAILRYGLWDIDVIINRTLVYGALTGIVITLYVLIVGVLSVLLQGQSNLVIPILVAGLIAVLFQPLRRHLHRAIDRLMYGDRDSPAVEPSPIAPLPPTEAAELMERQSSISYPSARPPTMAAQRLRVSTNTEPAWMTTLRDHWLVGDWMVWGALVGLTLVLIVVTVPARFQQLLQSGLEYRPSLAELGLSVNFYAVYFIVLEVLIALAFSLSAVVISWRKPGHWITMFVALTLVLFGAAIPSPMHALVTIRPTWGLPLHFVRAVGVGAFLIVFYVFPDGRFVPHWTRTLAVASSVWILSWPVFPAANPYNWPPPLPFLVLAGWFGTGVFAQIYRYARVSSLVECQQTKWVVYGLTTAVLGDLVTHLPWHLFPSLREHGLPGLIYTLAHHPFFALSQILVPVSIGIAVLRYRLWDIDIIIRRTLVFGLVTTVAALMYVVSVVLLQAIFGRLTAQQSTVVIVVSTLVIAALFLPLRRRVQEFIDRRFYREKVDVRQAFADFTREVRTIIELPELLRALVNRTTDLLHIAHGAVFLRDSGGAFELARARNLPEGQSEPLGLDDDQLGQLVAGAPIARPGHPTFPLLLPLLLPRPTNEDDVSSSPLIGVLALGPRLSEQRYSHEDQTLLMGLADQAGTAITVAQLIEEKQAEARRREETEQRLEAHRHSPIGRAETVAQAILANPQRALIDIHRLAREAGQSPEASQLLEHLPRVMSVLEAAEASLLTSFADGYSYLFFSQSEPELLGVGLRTLIGHLEVVAKSEEPRLKQSRLSLVPGQLQRTADDGLQPSAEVVVGAAEALAVYRLCTHALDTNSVAQIAELLPALEERRSGGPASFLADLERALAELHAAAAALRAYERVDTTQDRLAYLASAVERLSRLDRLARAELDGADRPLVQRIAEQWLAIVTGAMSELQTRAQLVCRLLTRHTWQKDMIALVLAIRNDGRGAALNLSVCLAPAPEYTLLDEDVQLDQLAAGEEAQITLRVHPHPADDASQPRDIAQGSFRARFLIRYADPRGPEQVEQFADEVQLLAAEGAFQFIPNPYVVGTPLQGGSPLFFGRRDLLAFIKENLQAAHRNNLVLIGQRRTGKTSLLKQLPAQLGDDYLPVYLDGQSLGLDPGLPNFFLALATEIAFALDDHRLSIAPPELSEFAERPAAAFERVFLPRVRMAMGGRHLLLLLDEFEELEGAVRHGSLDPSLFGFLRHLIQHAERLSVIFCGTHRLEELAADYWNVLFNISLYRQVGFLERGDGDHLIQDPVVPYGMRYDSLALEKIWQVTAGHPYFLQLLCHSLVNRHNRGGRSYMTIADVNAALEEILAAGEAHFVYLWAESDEFERLALVALSRMMPLTGYTTPAQVEDYLANRGVTVERRAVATALHHLELRDILTPATDGDGALGEMYRWKLGLLGLWVEKYRSLSRVVGEVRS